MRRYLFTQPRLLKEKIDTGKKQVKKGTGKVKILWT